MGGGQGFLEGKAEERVPTLAELQGQVFSGHCGETLGEKTGFTGCRHWAERLTYSHSTSENNDPYIKHDRTLWTWN